MPNYIDGKNTKKKPEGMYSGVDWNAVVGPMMEEFRRNPEAYLPPAPISPDRVGGGQAHLDRFEQAPVLQAVPQGIPASVNVPYEIPNVMVQYPAPPTRSEVAARQMIDLVRQIPVPPPSPGLPVYNAPVENMSNDPRYRAQVEDWLRQMQRRR